MKSFWYEVHRFVCFFLLISFVVTCCMMLFVKNLQMSLQIAFTEQHLETAAKSTFINVVIITIVFALVDLLWRRLHVRRRAAEISLAAQKCMAGDFSARIPLSHKPNDAFDAIADSFNLMAGELAGMETLRKDFVANVSHELKSPLAVIRNYAVLLQHSSLTEEERQRYFGVISAETERMAMLVSNILKLSKLENQQINPQNKLFDLGEQLCACLLTFEDAWEKKELKIETDLQEGVIVRNDEELLGIVWNNLFSNAIKFTPRKGSVSLSMRTDGEEAVVEVSDTGCGFGQEAGRHLFEKFYQGDPSHASEGNGLGLALVKRVVEIVGGEISVQSVLGEGSTFSVRIGRETNDEAQ